MKNQDEQHSRDDFWKELNKTKDDITDVKSAVSSISSELKGLTAAFQTFANNHNRPMNWVGLASLIVSLGVAMALWVNQSQEPIKENVWRLERLGEKFIERELSLAAESAANETKIDLMWELMRDDKDRMHQMEQSDAGQESAIKSLEQQLNDVDRSGSRVWNQRNLP